MVGEFFIFFHIYGGGCTIVILGFCVFNCIPVPAECLSGEVRCADGNCMPGKRCDHVYDCLDFSDELNCTGSCDVSEFQCDNEICIDERLRCDGLPDCKDGSDEWDCGRFFSITIPLLWNLSEGMGIGLLFNLLRDNWDWDFEENYLYLICLH